MDIFVVKVLILRCRSFLLNNMNYLISIRVDRRNETGLSIEKQKFLKRLSVSI